MTATGSFALNVGQFLPGDSALHDLDPRVKLALGGAFAVALFLVAGWPGLLVLAAGSAFVVALSRIPPSYLWRGLRPLVLLLLVAFVLQLISIPGRPLVEVGPFTVTAEGVSEAGRVTLRLLLLLMSGTVLTATTAPVALTGGVEWFLRPLERLRFPAGEAALMLTIALRFIPTLLQELDELVKAQQARGFRFEIRRPVQLAEAALPLVVPLFVLSFRRADDLAVAMESRGYRGSRGRTRYRVLTFRPRDGVAAAAGLAWLTVALGLGRWLPWIW